MPCLALSRCATLALFARFTAAKSAWNAASLAQGSSSRSRPKSASQSPREARAISAVSAGLASASQRRCETAVGQADDAAGPQPVEVAEQRLAHDGRMGVRHAVDAMAADDRQMRHAHALGPVLVDDRHAAQKVRVAGIAMHHVAQEPAH